LVAPPCPPHYKLNTPIPGFLNYHITNAWTIDCNGKYTNAGVRNNKYFYSLTTCNDLTTCPYTIEYDNSNGWCIKFNGNILYFSGENTKYPPTDSSTVWTEIDGILPLPNFDSYNPIPVSFDLCR
jgi:hypothetical protein